MTSSSSMQSARAGWMYRQTEVFKRWKKQYCVLYLDGGFSYFSDETRRNPEGSLHLPTSLNFFKVGTEVLNATAPSDRTISCLLELQTGSGSLFFCADSADDAEAWKSAMVEVKNMNVRGRANGSQRPPVGAGAYPPQPPAYAPQPAQAPPPKAGQPVSHQPYQAPPGQQPQVAPPAYYTQQGAAPPPAYPAAPAAYPAAPAAYPATTQQVVSTTVIPAGRRRRRGCYPTQTTVYSYPGQAYYGAGPNTTTVYHTNGTGSTGNVYWQNGQTSTVHPVGFGQNSGTTVIVQEDRNRNTDAATGFVAGAAVGGLIMAPLLFW